MPASSSAPTRLERILLKVALVMRWAAGRIVARIGLMVSGEATKRAGLTPAISAKRERDEAKSRLRVVGRSLVSTRPRTSASVSLTCCF